MEEIMSGTESERTAEDSQDEFESIEVEATELGENRASGIAVSTKADDSLEPYADEPLADEAWLANYRKIQEEKSELEEDLIKRLENRVRVSYWCSCGNCSLTHLRNISECYCCKELEGCCEALESDIVVEDLEEGDVLKCITEHPGFRPVCLEKWSLRLANGKYHKKDKGYYKKVASEERYLGSTAYREFSRLVYGFMGKKRIPLPSCAYNAIRTAFALQEDETFTGFELEDD
ncbi:unnamed protein product [Porites lobata]|uniref:Uncharacterized protein n=1 Tax=Porites lobata TaxID=104759 RepID=A0ABN8PVM8_9CNID|nr:unnamed protein product [Porites lobata]